MSNGRRESSSGLFVRPFGQGQVAAQGCLGVQAGKLRESLRRCRRPLPAPTTTLGARGSGQSQAGSAEGCVGHAAEPSPSAKAKAGGKPVTVIEMDPEWKSSSPCRQGGSPLAIPASNRSTR